MEGTRDEKENGVFEMMMEKKNAQHDGVVWYALPQRQNIPINIGGAARAVIEMMVLLNVLLI